MLPGPGEGVRYQAALLAEVDLHYTRAGTGLDLWKRSAFLAPLTEDTATNPWAEAREIGERPELDTEPEPGAMFGPLPARASRAPSYTQWKKRLISMLYRDRPFLQWRCRKPKLASTAEESEAEFRGRVRQALREERERRKEKLRGRYAPKLRHIHDRVERAADRVEVEEEQYEQRKTSTLISLGATVLGALFGPKLRSAGNVGRASTTARGMSRAAKDRGDIGRAEAALERARETLEALEAQFEQDLAEIEETYSIDETPIETLRIRARKSDFAVEGPIVVWCPWRVDSESSRAEAAWSETGWQAAADD